MLDFLKKVLGDSNESQIKQLQKTVDQINAFEPSIKALSDEELRAKTSEFKDRLNQGESLDDLLPEAFAVVREAAAQRVAHPAWRPLSRGFARYHSGNCSQSAQDAADTSQRSLDFNHDCAFRDLGDDRPS